MSFYYITGFVVLVMVYFITAMLVRNYPDKKLYVLPGLVLSVSMIVIALISLLTGENSLSNMGYSLVAFFVTIASLLGTILGTKFDRIK